MTKTWNGIQNGIRRTETMHAFLIVINYESSYYSQFTKPYMVLVNYGISNAPPPPPPPNLPPPLIPTIVYYLAILFPDSSCVIMGPYPEIVNDILLPHP